MCACVFVYGLKTTACCFRPRFQCMTSIVTITNVTAFTAAPAAAAAIVFLIVSSFLLHFIFSLSRIPYTRPHTFTLNITYISVWLTSTNTVVFILHANQLAKYKCLSKRTQHLFQSIWKFEITQKKTSTIKITITTHHQHLGLSPFYVDFRWKFISLILINTVLSALYSRLG